jgi:dolichol-phosphate mannosyltransferase
MPHRPKLALVIPTLREAETLPVVLDRSIAALSSIEIPWEILVVDDNSGDGTAEIVSRFARRDARIRLLVRRSRRGLSGAILHGWRHSSASILGVMDADLQHPPELLPLLLAEILNGRDLAIGSRYAQGSAVGTWNLLRRLVSAASVRLTWPLLPAPARPRDPLSGFFLVRRRSIERIAFRTSGFKLLLEILVRGRVRTVTEVPFVFGKRTSGRSKAGPKIAWDYMRLLAGLYADKLGFPPAAARKLLRGAQDNARA